MLSNAVNSIIESNIFGIFTTCTLGCALYFAYRLYTKSLDVLGWIFALGIIASSLLNWGEVYAYSEWYRRAFFFYGDDVTTVVAFFALYASWRSRIALAAVSFVALTVSGGKAPLVLFIFAVFLLLKVIDSHPVLNRYGIAGLAVVAVVGYFAVTGTSNLLEKEIRLTAPISEVGPGNSACENRIKCVETQFFRPLRQRVFSSIGGAWMMMSGGYRGEAWPHDVGEFADLMTRENPWGINDRFGISHLEWRKIGTVQNPYLKFGAGYGPLALGAVILFVLTLNAVAFRSMISSVQGSAEPPFIIFFMVNTLLNHTQNWLDSGSQILLLLSFCGCAILTSWVQGQGQGQENPRCAEGNAAAFRLMLLQALRLVSPRRRSH